MLDATTGFGGRDAEQRTMPSATRLSPAGPRVDDAAARPTRSRGGRRLPAGRAGHGVRRRAAAGPAAAGIRPHRRCLHRASARDRGRLRDAGAGRQCVRRWRHGDARRRRRRAGPLRPGRRGADPGLPGRGGRGDLHCRPGLGPEGRQHRVVHRARSRPHRPGAGSRRGAGRAARRAHRARALGHDDVRAGGGARHRLRRARVPAAAAHCPGHRGQRRLPEGVAGEPALAG